MADIIAREGMDFDDIHPIRYVDGYPIPDAHEVPQVLAVANQGMFSHNFLLNSAELSEAFWDRRIESARRHIDDSALAERRAIDAAFYEIATQPDLDGLRTTDVMIGCRTGFKYMFGLAIQLEMTREVIDFHKDTPQDDFELSLMLAEAAFPRGDYAYKEAVADLRVLGGDSTEQLSKIVDIAFPINTGIKAIKAREGEFFDKGWLLGPKATPIDAESMNVGIDQGAAFLLRAFRHQEEVNAAA